MHFDRTIPVGPDREADPNRERRGEHETYARRRWT